MYFIDVRARRAFASTNTYLFAHQTSLTYKLLLLFDNTNNEPNVRSSRKDQIDTLND